MSVAAGSEHVNVSSLTIIISVIAGGTNYVWQQLLLTEDRQSPTFGEYERLANSCQCYHNLRLVYGLSADLSISKFK